MTQEEHFLLTALGYLTLYPKSHSEGAFTFTDQFLTQLATVITDASSKPTIAHSLVKKLSELNIIRLYLLYILYLHVHLHVPQYIHFTYRESLQEYNII